MTVIDESSIAGKFPPPESEVDVLVVGAGPAGLAAATDLAASGLSVLLVDENPVDGQLIGMDVPLFYGGRADAGVQNSARMMERIFESNPAIEAAFEAGVDVQLGITCWGLYLPSEGSRELPGPIAGLADQTRAWTVGFKRVVLATGARDLVTFFDGADQPGVMGAAGLHALLTKYDAFDGRRMVVFGSGDLALASAELALSKGVEVAALVEVAAEPQGDPDRIAALSAQGVSIFYNTVIASAKRGAFGVEAVEIVASDGVGERQTIECDTVCLALGLVPVVDLFDVAGASLVLDGTRGGFAPDTPDGVTTTSPLVFGAGDCMGVGVALADPEASEAHGRQAAAAVKASLGLAAATALAAQFPSGADQLPYRRMVMETLLATGGTDVLACQCEEVTRGDLLGVRAPRYLGDPTEKSLCHDLKDLAKAGPLSHDQMKRLTRVSMGACQARRCREQVAMLMAIGADLPTDAVPLAGYRAPVRPLPLGVLATLEEMPDMAKHWSVWFAIPTQWIPYDLIGTPEEFSFVDEHTHL
ncbi:opine oxidase subunit A [Hartmannibacter diazotrophicus]|uniref:Opine oxidase subunit A n=1 Tax=Hartmannibacter diazotrophicus TaxID=1482074 RepID=A0A2C9DCY0_9HYPH|nr:FAD-dependent oxidoreductase [Hartmannibacter diazotrophicus]SON58029.1 opine oxidase subunit A [Hartmannibacter diazotrophicus]